jgi:hypothetical protein
MSPLKVSALLAAAAIVGAVGVGAATQRTAIGDLSNNEGILVDVKSFKIIKGKAKGDPQAQLIKLGARQVADGAIVFRSGDKLYIADGRPEGVPQAMNPSDPMPTTIDGFNSLFESF